MYIKETEKNMNFLDFFISLTHFPFLNSENGTRMKEGWIVWMKLIELNNDNYISSFTWAMEKVLHIFLVVFDTSFW